MIYVIIFFIGFLLGLLIMLIIFSIKTIFLQNKIEVLDNKLRELKSKRK